MALWRKVMTSIWEADIPFASKLYLNIFFFGTRMAATHLVSFFFYLLLIPLCATMPEVVVPFWALVYAPVLVTISTCTFTKNGLLYAIPYVLFENANTLVKLNAMISGLLGLEHANEWVVTTKLGKWVAQKVERAKTTRLARRLAPTLRAKPFHFKELLMSVFFLFCALWGVLRHRLFGYSAFLLSPIRRLRRLRLQRRRRPVTSSTPCVVIARRHPSSDRPNAPRGARASRFIATTCSAFNRLRTP